MKENDFPGEMSVEQFREFGHKIIDWAADYFHNVKDYPVFPKINPGDILSKLPDSPPEKGEDFLTIFSDIDNKILPGITHWNHPSFFAYFNSSASASGILAEIISAVFNNNSMLWKTSPASTELEIKVTDWFRKLLNLPDNFWGIIYDTASVSSMHALAAAREKTGYKIREKGLAGRKDLNQLRIYTSQETHSSIDKAAMTLGLGLESIRKIPVDDNFRMIPQKLIEAISEDRKNGITPFCAVATIGTTSTTSVDNVDEISAICRKENLWLHVDGAHSGVTAMLPEMKDYFKGIENADSFVVNPHKWLFTPVDLSLLYVKDKNDLRRAFSLVPEYLRTNEDDSVVNFMDYGVPLGRRFRSLKLWFIIRYFGAEGLKNIIRNHIKFAKNLEAEIKNTPGFEVMAPVPFSTICFRAVPEKNYKENLNSFNEKLMHKINESGKIFLSHTKLKNNFAIRFSISNLRTTEDDVKAAWLLIKEKYKEILND